MLDINVSVKAQFQALLIACMALVGLSVSAVAQVGDVAQDATPVATTTTKAAEGRRVFGDWMFSGSFAKQAFVGFNPSYEVAIGDQVAVQMWGGFEFQEILTVDNQGNIFLPRVGPIQVLGVRNGALNSHVVQAVQKIFKKNVGIYASLTGAEPVKIFVTGFVAKPGLYAGHSSDSVLRFLDMAGGIDPARGSYIALEVLRGGELLKAINLYDFLLQGKLPSFQLFDGDTILVKGLNKQIGVVGLVQNAFVYEFSKDTITVADALALAHPNSRATHVRINRNNRVKEEVEYYSLNEAAEMTLTDGDVLDITSDKLPGSISVRVEGEHSGRQEYILPYGARLEDVLSQLSLTENAQIDAIQLYRISVRARQKEMLMAQLRAVESSVLTARSNTTNEAALRVQEAQMVLQWVERARSIEPKGQVALGNSNIKDDILLEAGDIIRIPRRSNLVMVHGDVLFPSAMTYDASKTTLAYIEKAGGFTQGAGSSNILILRRDGSFEKVSKGKLKSKKLIIHPGDEIFVLPRVQTKYIQVASDITSVLYQIAVAAGVILRL